MNLMGPRARHVILSAVPDALGAQSAIDPGIDVEFPADAPPLHGKPGLARYRDLARYMQQFDLVLSYNWGSMDGVMAHRIFAPFRELPPLIHHEDGFNEDESVRRNWKRRSEEHTSELQSLMRISYAVFCLKKKNTKQRS